MFLFPTCLVSYLQLIPRLTEILSKSGPSILYLLLLNSEYVSSVMWINIGLEVDSILEAISTVSPTIHLGKLKPIMTIKAYQCGFISPRIPAVTEPLATPIRIRILVPMAVLND